MDLHTHLDDDLHQWLKVTAAKTRKSIKVLVEEAVIDLRKKMLRVNSKGVK